MITVEVAWQAPTMHTDGSWLDPGSLYYLVLLSTEPIDQNGDSVGITWSKTTPVGAEMAQLELDHDGKGVFYARVQAARNDTGLRGAWSPESSTEFDGRLPGQPIITRIQVSFIPGEDE